MSVSIIIADEIPALREGVRKWFEAHADLQVIGEAPDVLECVPLVSRLQPHLLIIDVPPGPRGLEVLTSLRQVAPQTRIVVWSRRGDEESLLEVLQQGVRAYVLKTSPAEVLVKAVRAAARGSYFLDRPFSERSVESYLRKAQTKSQDLLKSLTPREREVLHFVVEGSSSAEIARHLHISPRTVEQHRARMMRKLDLHSPIDLVRFALRRGILTWDE